MTILRHTSAALVMATVDREPGGSVVSVIAANPAAYALTRSRTAGELGAVLSGALEQAITRGESPQGGLVDRFQFEHALDAGDGAFVHLMIEVSAVGSLANHCAYTIIYLKDITAGKALQRQMEWLSALPEANPNIVLIVSCPDRIDYVNPTGRAWLEAHSTSSPGALRALLPEEFGRAVCQGCDRTERQSWIIRHEEREYDVRKSPLPDRSRCMITINDVTEIRTLTREHEIFFRVFRSAHTPIMVTDRSGRFEFVNDRFRELYGYSGDDLSAATPGILNPGRDAYRELGYSDDEYDSIFRDLWRSISDPEIGFWEREIPNRAADGRIVWVRMLIHAIPGDAGRPGSYVGFPIDVSDSRQRELELRLEVYQTIADLAELRDNETGNHIKRVGRFAMELARRMGHSRHFQEELLNFAPLHDIGKVGIPDGILPAPRQLTAEETEIMRRHAILGHEIFRNRPSLETAVSIALGHHERWDGTGYPHGLAGEENSLCARIVAVCDAYDALRSERPYKGPWTHEEALRAIREGSGTQFDPEVVAAFLDCHECIEGIHATLPDT